MFRHLAERLNDNPDRAGLGFRALGALAMVAAATEYFVFGSQSTGELIGDSILELSGIALIAASYLPGSPA